MALGMSDVRGIVARVCARPEALDACRRRDLGTVIQLLGEHGVTQGQLAGLTGIPQGRLSEYKTGKRTPRASTIFEAFADGVGMPSVAREALGLASRRLAVVSIDRPKAGVPASDVGLIYPDSPAEAAENLAWLWRSDLGDELASRGRIEPGAWDQASLAWLVGSAAQPESGTRAGVRIGGADVARFRATVEMFNQLDDRFGGGHARSSLIHYLSSDAERLLRGRYSEAVGRELFSAVAEATLLGAWMTYDSVPDSALAQRYFVQALALAQAGDDRLLGASVLDAMSHQATYTGRFREAANLARAAAAGTRGVATPTLTSHFHVMEARALARMGDARACDLALSEAVHDFERRKPDDDPGWIQYFDDAELSAEFGHCLRDLRRPRDATSYASRSLSATGETTFVRSDFFVAMVLADAHMDGGDLEQACGVALTALNAGEQIRSARCINYIQEFRQRLSSVGKSRLADEFREQAAGSRLWRIASQPRTRAS